MNLRPDVHDDLTDALSASSYSYTSGSTHGFYHYPARFSPDIARAIIDAFSERGEWVMDPFMGGGTSIIEGLSLGRRMIGIDLNALAHFVAAVRTSPLSTRDEQRVRAWTRECAIKLAEPGFVPERRPRIGNFPGAVETFVAGALAYSRRLRLPRQRNFARCVLLRLGQLVLDCRDFAAPRRRRLCEKLPALVEEMIDGLHEFVDRCRAVGFRKSEIRNNRILIHGNAVRMGEEPLIKSLEAKPRLIFTSPPYPSVHVLYHRWQYRGRKETAAPFWIANVPDGYYEAHYTGGSRTPTGRKNYFEMITAAFRSVRQVMHPRGLVVQLIGFSDMKTQLPLYLYAMRAAGFDEWLPPDWGSRRLGRRVPNRKWYAKLHGPVDASAELLLFHRPS
jgi:hypothetical protein